MTKTFNFTKKPDSKFMVPSGSLGFSVLVYSVLSLVAISFLMLRRRCGWAGRAELGGPRGSARASAIFMVGLWCVYITLSTLQAYDVIHIDF